MIACIDHAFLGVARSMFIRTPAQGPLANSNARLAVMLRSERGTRVIEIGDRTVTALLLISAILLAWYLFATLYLVLRDDVMASMISGQRRSHYAYEDRILELRSKIDRITARQLVNQDTIEDRVGSLVARQAELEARQIVVADLGSRADRAGLGVATRSGPVQDSDIPTGAIALPFADPAPRKPRPLMDSVPSILQSMPALPGQGLPGQGLPGQGFEAPKMRGPMEGIVNEVERRSSRMERAQVDLLQKIGDAAEGEITKSRKTVAAIGIDPARFGRNAFGIVPIRRPAPLDELMLRDVSPDAAPGTALGGPLLSPVPARSGGEIFETAMSRAEGAVEGAKKARSILRAIPVGRPLGERYELSSGFGTRLDPFTRSPALHSGLDFRAPSGTPVRAVAAGKIIDAGPNGGYGRMVEIDHGYGITTRYAHLSSIAVNDGDSIEKGAVIGHVGTTGRSTGPHLHYEVRIDDDAADPMRFVRAEKLLKPE